LQKPFTPSELEWRVGATDKDKTKGIALVYVTNRAIQNRLDEIFTPFGWRNEYKEWKGGQLCGVSIWDSSKNEWITKWDGAQDTNFEGLKGGLSDSMKRAGYQWGIGRYLYELPNTWVKVRAIPTKKGETYVIDLPDADIEKIIPSKFLPDGYIKKVIDKSESEEIKDKNNENQIEKGYKYLTVGQVKNLNETQKRCKISDKSINTWIKMKYNLDSREQLDIKQYESLCNVLETKRKEKEAV
jgi:hypothetical protein